MATTVKMPQVGQDIEFAIINEWHVKEGDEVKEGDVLATVESDKASFEVTAPASGTVLHLLFGEGDEAAVFKPIAYLGQKGENIPDRIDPAERLPEKKSSKDNIPALTRDSGPHKAQISSPSARRIAREKNIDLSEIEGTGPFNRIIKKDVEKHFESLKTEKRATPLARKIAEESGVIFNSIQGSGYSGRIMKKDVIASIGPVKSAVLKEAPGDQVIIFNKTRKRIAERLSFSKMTIPHYYLFSDVNITNALKWRETANKNPVIRISINDIIIKAATDALKLFPEMNSWVDDEKMLLKPEINIGVAVSAPIGLLVPVIPDAGSLDLTQINIISRKNSDDARRGIIHLDKPGTFTISNLGMLGIDSFLPIINPPECAILSVGAVVKKVVPDGDKLTVIESITLGLACDHRAVDGAKAAEFLSCVKKIIEDYTVN